MVKFCRIIALLGVCTLLMASQSQKNIPDHYEKYENSKHDYSLHHPKTWPLKDGNLGDMKVLYSNEETDETFTGATCEFMPMIFGKEFRLKKFFMLVQQKLRRKFMNFAITNHGSFRAGPHPGYFMFSRYQVKEAPMVHMDERIRPYREFSSLYILEPKKGMWINCFAPPRDFLRYRKDFKTIARSFRIE